LEEHERYMIKKIGEDGKPIAPTAHANKFTRQCRVLVRDNIPITIREWKKTKMEPVSYVRKKLKNMLWKKLMVNFTLPAAPEVDRAYKKIKDHWDAFVEYKTSEVANKRSKINKKNAAKKKYHHTMGQGGYKSSKPKWKKMEDDLIAKGIIPEILKWNDRSRVWFYGNGGKLDS
jgi:hypothetical protein